MQLRARNTQIKDNMREQCVPQLVDTCLNIVGEYSMPVHLQVSQSNVHSVMCDRAPYPHRIRERGRPGEGCEAGVLVHGCTRNIHVVGRHVPDRGEPKRKSMQKHATHSTPAQLKGRTLLALIAYATAHAV
jgi:hypothetical protein